MNGRRTFQADRRLKGAGQYLRRHLGAGLLVTLPLLVTILLLRWLFTALDSVLQPIFRVAVGQPLPGLGLAAGFLLILAAGVIASNMVGRRAIASLDRLMLRVPLARSVYGATKQMSEVLLDPRRAGFRRVVLLEWPRQGVYTLGFVTGEHRPQGAPPLLKVFVISTPNPTTGFLMFVPEHETQALDLSIEDGLMLMLSGGIAGPLEPVARALGTRTPADLRP